MENKNTGLKVMIIILGMLVLGLIGYIVYDKMLKENNTVTENNKDNNNEQDTSDHVELEENIKTELIKVFRFVYDYYDWSNGYCGGYSHGDVIVPNDNNSWWTPSSYTASDKYYSFNEMINHLKQYMTENVIYGHRFMSSDNYIEKEGKLYCPNFDKGGLDYQIEDIIIKYSKPYPDVIYTIIEITSTYEEYSMKETYKVTFEKRNNNWIISSYEKQD